MDFTKFKLAVAAQFEKIKAAPLFYTTATKDEMWGAYLGSFPPGTDPIFRERTEHDCACCRHFIRDIGGLVAYVNGELVSIWDINIPDEPAYQTVANALSALVKSKPIESRFMHYEKHIGTDKNFEQIVDQVHTWHHFHVNLPTQYVHDKKAIPTLLGRQKSLRDLYVRGLETITLDAVDTVLELVAQNSLYRGAEHKAALLAFRKAKVEYTNLPSKLDKDMYGWVTFDRVMGSVAAIRNTSIGTLLVSLSEGMELEDSVKAFEAMVAPANYKRPTALVTAKMVEAAKAKVAELGLTSALERRHARLTDIGVNNLLFVDRGVKPAIDDDPFADVATTKAHTFGRVAEVGIDAFIKDVLPTATTLEVLAENKHVNNLMSLIAPADPTANPMFKWSNRFSWSYNGNFADSIKERVKAAGGKVDGYLCCRLAWDYEDDLDFHMHEPGNGHIYYGNRRRMSPLGGMLDVDANGIDGIRENPVENIVYAKQGSMAEGVYTLRVHNFSRRSDGVGFTVEIDVDNVLHTFEYGQVVRGNAYVDVAKLRYSKAKGIEVIESLPSTTVSKKMWGIDTQKFVRVKAMLLSPNHWDGEGVGNKHYMFVLDGCTNEGPVRGFYNEFLRSDLDEHRKVLEIVGSKLKVPDSAEQLSGVGFSSTKQDEVICRVTGQTTRVVRVRF